jgi:hypothetical protein
LRRWEGGRVFKGRERESFLLERQHGGARYTITLPARNEKEALAQLALFEQGPAGRSQGRAEKQKRRDGRRFISKPLA